MRYFTLPISVLWAVIMVLLTGTNTAFGYHECMDSTSSVDMQGWVPVCLVWLVANSTASLIDWDRGVMSVNTDGESR